MPTFNPLKLSVHVVKLIYKFQVLRHSNLIPEDADISLTPTASWLALGLTQPSDQSVPGAYYSWINAVLAQKLTTFAEVQNIWTYTTISLQFISF